LFLQGPFTFISPTAYLAMAGVTARRSSSVDVMTNYGRILPLSFALDEMEPITRGELDLLKTHNGNILEISTIRALRIHVQQIDTALTSPKSPAANSRKDSNAEEDHVCIPISTVLDDIPAEFSKDHLRNLTMAHLNKVIYSKSAHIYNAFRRSINCGRVDTAVRSESSGKVGLEDIELNLCFCWRKGQDDQCAQATYKIRFVDFDIQRILRRTFPGASDCAFRNVFIDDIEQIPRVLQPVPYGLEAGEIRHVRFVPPRIDQETGAAITTSLDGAPTQTAYLEQTPKPIPHPPQPIAPLTIDSQTFTPKVILGQTPAVELGTNVIVKQGPATSIGGQMVAFNNNDLVVGSKTIPLPSSLFEQESSAALVWNGHQVTIISQPGNREQTLVAGGSTIIISDGQYTSAGHTMTIGDGKITVDGSLTYSFKPLTSNVPTIVKSPTPDGKTIAADGSSGKQSSAPRKYWQGLKFQLGIFTALLFILP
jgi:hypothetical protein